jgi:hypothetical protein
MPVSSSVKRASVSVVIIGLNEIIKGEHRAYSVSGTVHMLPH